MIKKLTLTICLLLFTFGFTKGQTWTNVGAPFCTNLGGGTTYGMDALTEYNGKLYAGGYAENGIVAGLGIWDGFIWDSIPGLKFYAFTSVNAMVVFNNKLYLGGEFYIHDTACNVAVWDGTSVSALGKGTTDWRGSINAMSIYNGELYVAGTFDSLGGQPIESIAKWNGSQWLPVGGGIQPYNTMIDYSINALAVYNGELYAGGIFDTVSGIVTSNIAKWNGVNWNSVGGGIPKGIRYSSDSLNMWDKSVYALCVFNNKLYVGGFFDSVGNTIANNIAQWDGAAWSTLNSGLGGKETDMGWAIAVHALYGVNNKLYAGGSFDSAGSVLVNCIAQWDGVSWSGVGGGVTDGIFGTGPQAVLAIYEYNNYLYMAGNFDSVQNVLSCSLSQWTTPISIKEVSTLDKLIRVYPNPSNGKFTIQESGVRNKEQVVEVYNVFGQKVYSKTFSTFNSQCSIDLNNQPSGIYLYRITDKTGKLLATGKLVVER